MSYKILATSNFTKQLKALLKKYPSLPSDLQKLKTDLDIDPQTGVPLGKDCYKIRISIASKGKGKSGGARVITYVKIV
jgi:mRNA-degrading endonuclease RelE of RelBE toxin-antitoxin system